MAQLRMGLAVWGFRGWEGDFMPAGVRQQDMLRLFAMRMHCVEGNDVFYGIPSAEVLEKRVAQTPEGFLFCPKVPRAISHDGLLTPKISEALRFLAHMKEHLGPRLGPIFLQLPPSYGPAEGPDLAGLLNAWRREAGHPLLVEVRHVAWYRDPPRQRLDTLLGRLGMGRVVLDTRPLYSGSDDPQADNPRKKPPVPLHASAPGESVMVRFISHPDLARNEDFLRGWAHQIHEWLEVGKDVYFFAHCPKEEHSPRSIRRLQQLLEERGAPVSPLPWDSLPPEPQQSRLF
jgi:uncharacterized protein YecE (DUF72 family)